MILTEDEAKKHYCDQKFNKEGKPPINCTSPLQMLSEHMFCEGTACMQWVEHNKVKKTGYCGRNIAHANQRNVMNTGVK